MSEFDYRAVTATCCLLAIGCGHAGHVSAEAFLPAPSKSTHSVSPVAFRKSNSHFSLTMSIVKFGGEQQFQATIVPGPSFAQVKEIALECISETGETPVDKVKNTGSPGNLNMATFAVYAASTNSLSMKIRIEYTVDDALGVKNFDVLVERKTVEVPFAR